MSASAHRELSTGPGAPLVTAGGIAYQRVGQGPPLVLLHGSAGSWRHWARNIEALSRIRTVLVPDQPGFGRSRDVPADMPVDAYFDLVTQAIREMADGSPAIDLAGFSFGGQIAAAAAVRLGARARRLALLTPSGFDFPKERRLEMPRRKDFAATSEGRRAFHKAVLLTIMLAEDAAADEQAVDIQEANVAEARFDGRHISWSARMPEMLADVPCPILLAYGDRDAMPYPSPAVRIARCRAVRPDVQVRMVAGAGHWLQYERADAVNGLLADFFG